MFEMSDVAAHTGFQGDSQGLTGLRIRTRLVCSKGPFSSDSTLNIPNIWHYKIQNIHVEGIF